MSAIMIAIIHNAGHFYVMIMSAIITAVIHNVSHLSVCTEESRNMRTVGLLATV